MYTAIANSQQVLPSWIEKTLVAVDTRRVFLAEADPFMRRLLTRRFQAAGHDVIAAENGRSMLEYLHELPRPTGASGDVLVTDVEMPEMGGFELVDRARAAGWSMPVVFLKANPSPEELRSSMERQALRFLTKPLSVGDLLGAVAGAGL